MTSNYYDPDINFQDIFHKKFDLYGLSKIIMITFNQKIKILETMCKA